MCRILLAQGIFSSERVLDQAIAMSQGQPGMERFTSAQNHLDGCGIIWKDPLSGEIRCHRELGSLSRAKYKFLSLLRPGVGFLVIHVHSASVDATKKNSACIQPLKSDERAPVQWALMHDGYVPAAYLKFPSRQPESETQEYFDYIIPKEGTVLDGKTVLTQLEALLACDPQDPSRQCAAANAIIVNRERFYVVNCVIDMEYPLGDSPIKKPYYRLYGCQYNGALYIASEALPLLTPGQNWEQLPFQSVHEYIFTPGWPPRVKPGVNTTLYKPIFISIS